MNNRHPTPKDRRQLTFQVFYGLIQNRHSLKSLNDAIRGLTHSAQKTAHSTGSKSDKRASHPTSHDISFCKALCFEAFRYQLAIKAHMMTFLEKPLRKQDQDIESILLLALTEWHFLSTPAHAIISEWVKQTPRHKSWAKGLINAVLRKIQASPAMIIAPKSTYPSWFVDTVEHAWPLHAEAIFKQGNEHAPMTLRVNLQKTTREDAYLRLSATLESPPRLVPDVVTAIQLNSPAPVEQLPGFLEGECSVQDEAAQRVMSLWTLHPGEWILDACAAPGGKTAHLLETQPLIHLVATDKDPTRLQKITETLTRLGFISSPNSHQHPATHASLHILVHNHAEMAQHPSTSSCAPSCTPSCASISSKISSIIIDSTLQFEGFDKILVDAPCSGTGVIRRHPDIKHFRTLEDIESLTQTQAAILNNLWNSLKPGGELIYTTCSILPEENDLQIQAFLQNHPDALSIPLSAFFTDGIYGVETSAGFQLFPQTQGHDGFFYAKLKKLASS